MKWIETNEGDFINLDMLGGICAGKKPYKEKYKVGYVFPCGTPFNEYFDTEQEAKDRMKELKHIIGITDSTE